MLKLDPRLVSLQEQDATTLAEFESLERFAVEGAATEPKVVVLLEFQDDLAKAEEAGFEVWTVAANIASGRVAIKNLEKLSALDSVLSIESSRPLTNELDLAIVETRADEVHSGPPGRRGTGVIVAVIDTGIDYQHGSFRKPDGSTRLLAIWDQARTPTGTQTSPSGYSYGVEYDRSDINDALNNPDPQSIVPHTDPGQHGTHVAGIAAGDGSPAGDGKPAFTFVGVAPEADIIMVRNATQTQALGDSARTLDAVKYIFDKAAALNKPVVINLSQGDNLGPHDGTSLLELGIDNLLGAPGRCMVKSAGNAADDDIHARGSVAAGGTETIQFIIPSNDTSPDIIDIWYSGSDSFDIRITPPGGTATAAVSPGVRQTFTLDNNNQVIIDSRNNDPRNGDKRIYIELIRGTASAIQQGTWSFTLEGSSVTEGTFDAWTERGGRIPRFIGPHLDPSRTISVPGTATEIITAACYINRSSGVGSLSAFSSRGPTRDGRNSPTLAAPGQRVISAKPHSEDDPYQSMSGTSMSAPHIAGAIALMLQKNRNLRQEQVRDCLVNTARQDAFTGATPNTGWGAGKIDVVAAVNCAPNVVVPPRTLPIDPRCRTRPTDPRCRTKPTDPRCRTKPTDPRCRTKPTDPRCRTKPTDPRCRTKPTDPRCRTKLTDPRCQIRTLQTDPRCRTKPTDPRCGILQRPHDQRIGMPKGIESEDYGYQEDYGYEDYGYEDSGAYDYDEGVVAPSVGYDPYFYYEYDEGAFDPPSSWDDD